MRRLSLIISAMLCSLMLLSCKGKELQSSFGEEEIPHFEMGGDDVFVFDPLRCQTACNEDDRQFMVFTDTMSDYYIVTLEKIPTETGTTVKGTIVWTSDFDIEKKSDVKFTVERIDPNGWIWLWNSSSKIGVAVQRL